MDQGTRAFNTKGPVHKLNYRNSFMCVFRVTYKYEIPESHYLADNASTKAVVQGTRAFNAKGPERFFCVFALS